jgi:hypothetical protein
MGGIVRGVGAAVTGSAVGSVVGAGIGSALGGGIGSVVGAGVGSAVGGTVGSAKGGILGSVVGGLGTASAGAGSPVSWSLPAETSETILSLQQVDIPAVLLAIYRITNTGATSPNAPGGTVLVQTDNAPFELGPGMAIDISTQTITIRSGAKPAHGTYQLLGNALVGNRAT